MCACSSAHLCVRQREYRHLCSHLNGVFLLLQTHLSLLLLLLQTLDCKLSLYLQVLLQLPITVSFPSSHDSQAQKKSNLPVSSASWSPVSGRAGFVSVSLHPRQPVSVSPCAPLSESSVPPARHAPAPVCPEDPHSTLSKRGDSIHYHKALCNSVVLIKSWNWFIFKWFISNKYYNYIII